VTKIFLGVALVLLSSCGLNDAGVKGAKGDTPIRYVICGGLETNCFVAARFKDFDSCGSHKQWSEMLCDRLSNPGTMVCKRENKTSQVAFAYCTS